MGLAQPGCASQPTHSTDSTNPDYYVSTNGLNYDVTGTGQNEVLIVDTAGPGPVDHIESPVTVGTTVVDVYQYVTWVDDPGISGTQNLKRPDVLADMLATLSSATIARPASRWNPSSGSTCATS